MERKLLIEIKEANGDAIAAILYPSSGSSLDALCEARSVVRALLAPENAAPALRDRVGNAVVAVGGVPWNGPFGRGGCRYGFDAKSMFGMREECRCDLDVVIDGGSVFVESGAWEGPFGARAEFVAVMARAGRENPPISAYAHDLDGRIPAEDLDAAIRDLAAAGEFLELPSGMIVAPNP